MNHVSSLTPVIHQEQQASGKEECSGDNDSHRKKRQRSSRHNQERSTATSGITWRMGHRSDWHSFDENVPETYPTIDSAVQVRYANGGTSEGLLRQRFIQVVPVVHQCPTLTFAYVAFCASAIFALVPALFFPVPCSTPCAHWSTGQQRRATSCWHQTAGIGSCPGAQ